MKPLRILLAVTVTATLAIIGYSFQTDTPLFSKGGLKVYEMKASPDFPDAELKFVSPEPVANMLPMMIDTFKFEVKNYQLGAQTPDADQKMCANSAKGQHIHFILDNAPYVASYSPNIAADIKPGHHVLLAFLSRSYHESIKHKGAYILKEFNGGADLTDNFDENAPHVFLSRPKGEYIGEKETGKVMLDFYLVNCDLSPTGYKVRATINGTEFVLTKWEPYLIEGLPLGESSVKLELLDKNNVVVVSPFNGMERKFTLKLEPVQR